MKKFLLLFLLVSLGAARLAAVPRDEIVARVDSCEAILREFQADATTRIPDAVLQKARAIVIVNQFKAGFIFGVKDGYGVVMVKKANNQWSIPVLVSAGELSLGLQLGADAIETVMVITDDNTPRIMFNQRFNVGVDAKAVAGPHTAEAERINKELLETPVIVYTKKKGLFAGATVKTGWLQRNDSINFDLYNTKYTMPELLYSDWVQPNQDVQHLMDYVKQIAP
ncbi:MAG: lipid-binding SYLF domain-containing protein [Verrucomicrobia bacterium]|nr:lipid-binding SYLF domain-containing protein [Verrucomicrobiota bacterium]